LFDIADIPQSFQNLTTLWCKKISIIGEVKELSFNW